MQFLAAISKESPPLVKDEFHSTSLASGNFLYVHTNAESLFPLSFLQLDENANLSYYNRL